MPRGEPSLDGESGESQWRLPSIGHMLPQPQPCPGNSPIAGCQCDDELMWGTVDGPQRMHILRWLVGGLTLLLVLAATPTAVAGSWVVQQATSPPPVPSGNLSAVSCPTERFCAAGGLGPLGFLAVVWNGAAWEATSISGPTGVNSPTLIALSCASQAFCMAIGSTSPHRGGQPFADAWTGARWRMRPAAQPVSVRAGVLSGISCRTRAFCVAVGSKLNRRNRVVPLSERWNGSSWAVQSVTPPTGGSATRLSAVSCTSVKACTAVGSASVVRHVGRQLVVGVSAVAERWNGTTWAQRIADQSSGPALTGVSCTSSTFCLAVGSGGPGSSPTASGPVAERWLLLGQADPRRQEPRPTLRPQEHSRRGQSHSEPDLGPAFDPTRAVARAGNQNSTPGLHSCRPALGGAAVRVCAMPRLRWLAPTGSR